MIRGSARVKRLQSAQSPRATCAAAAMRPAAVPDSARSMEQVLNNSQRAVYTMRSQVPRFSTDVSRPDGLGRASAATGAVMSGSGELQCPAAGVVSTALASTLRGNTASGMRSTKPRFTARDWHRAADSADQHYDGVTRHGPKADLVVAAANSPRSYSSMRSRSPRFERPRFAAGHETRHLGPGSYGIPEPSVTRRVPSTSLSRSGVQRAGKLGAPKAAAVRGVDGHSMYDHTVGRKAGMVDALQTSPRTYSVMQSRASRWGPQRAGFGADNAEYDIESKGPTASMAAVIAAAPNPYSSVFQSRAQRGIPAAETAAMRVEPVHPNAGTKTSLVKSVMTSPRKYSIMKSATSRDTDQGNVFSRQTCAAPHLGPGTYDVERALGALSTTKAPTTYSLPGGMKQRFAGGSAPEASGSGNAAVRADRLAWTGGRGGRVSSTARFSSKRPDTADLVYDLESHGPKRSFAAEINASPRKFSIMNGAVTHTPNAAQLDPATSLNGDPRLQRSLHAPAHVTARREAGLSHRLAAAGYDPHDPYVQALAHGDDAAVRSATAEGHRVPRGHGRPSGLYYDSQLKQNGKVATITITEPHKPGIVFADPRDRFYQWEDKPLKSALATMDFRAQETGTLQTSLQGSTLRYGTMGSTVRRLL